jgi:hypothetical protein
MVIGFLATAYGLSCGKSREEVQWAAFLGAFIGAGFGLLIYGFAVMSGAILTRSSCRQKAA